MFRFGIVKRNPPALPCMFNLSIYSHTALSSMAVANLFMAIVIYVMGMHGIFPLALIKLTNPPYY